MLVVSLTQELFRGFNDGRCFNVVSLTLQRGFGDKSSWFR